MKKTIFTIAACALLSSGVSSACSIEEARKVVLKDLKEVVRSNRVKNAKVKVIDNQRNDSEYMALYSIEGRANYSELGFLVISLKTCRLIDSGAGSAQAIRL